MSSFAQRFEFARNYQAVLRKRESDTAFAKAIGVAAASISDYKGRTDPPPFDRVLAIAERCSVDPGWLAFGDRTAAAGPDGFATWLSNQQINQQVNQHVSERTRSATKPAKRVRKTRKRKPS